MKRQQRLKRKRKEEKQESTPVNQDLPVLQTLPLDPRALEIHIFQRGPGAKRGETNPIGRE